VLNLQVYEVEGFINQQQLSISLAAVNRILNVSVPDPFLSTPNKRSGYARLVLFEGAEQIRVKDKMGVRTI